MLHIWIILAAGGDTGAHTNCMVGPLSDKPGYLAQCRGVNVAIAVDAIVFLLWIPISVVIVCGTVERGLWWWGEDDGWAQGEAKVGGANMMSEEEFDMKIGVGGSKRIKRRQTVFPADEDQPEGMVMIQQPKPAFVTPIASQFRSNGGYGDDLENGDDDDFTNFAPSSYRRHHQQRQQQQQQRQRLQRKTSTNSLSSRLSTFFGAGWGADAMPPSQDGGAAGGAAALPPMPTMPSQYAQENARNAAANKGGAPVTATATTARKKDEEKKREEEKEKEEEEDIPLHGDSYASQWHSRWA
ncbi:hypothetical protein BGX24_000167 [Mortierella sp. AD032]|nr:hypothetical protein BGX24_000167 [Mortierella sp. AD032]